MCPVCTAERRGDGSQMSEWHMKSSETGLSNAEGGNMIRLFLLVSRSAACVSLHRHTPAHPLKVSPFLTAVASGGGLCSMSWVPVPIRGCSSWEWEPSLARTCKASRTQGLRELTLSASVNQLTCRIGGFRSWKKFGCIVSVESYCWGP